MLLGAAPLLALLVAIFMAHIVLRPPRMGDGKAIWLLKRLTPADLGFAFKMNWFEVRDSLTAEPIKLASWWIGHPGNPSRTVILVHGYADAKVGAIAWAPVFHSLGCNILAVDLRAHGESGGKFTTAGNRERHDLEQVIGQLRARYPSQTRQLILFGASLGAAVVGATALVLGDHGCEGVILESPFADFRHAAMAHLSLVGAPGRIVQRLAMRIAQWQVSADFGSVSPVRVIPQIPCPLLMIQSEIDPFVPPADQAALKEAASARPSNSTRQWLAAGTQHLMAVVERPDEYRKQISEFLNALDDGAMFSPEQFPHPLAGAPASRPERMS